jgi:osmoprotectant transport system substrate-binding protein
MHTLARFRFRSSIGAALVATALLAGCGSSGSSDTSTKSPGPTGSAGSAAPANSVASQLAFGAGAECPQRPLCLQGLASVYGLTFKSVTTLDSGGALTVAALKKGDIQVGLIFTSDGQIAANNWVLLEDDKKLQPADPVTPIANNALATAYGKDLATVVDGISAKITTEDLVGMNKAVDVDQRDPDAVAQDFVKAKGLAPGGTAAPKSGPAIKIGSANFTESVVLANVYAAVLKLNGFTVETKLKVGTREVYYPALKTGNDINFIPDYAGTLLTFVKKDATPSTEASKVHDALVAALKDEGVTVFASSAAEDKNGFVVTSETAKKYNLKTLSDLAKPAS